MADRMRGGEELSEEEAKILRHVASTDINSLKGSVGPGRVLVTDKDYADEIARLEASTRRYTSQAQALAAQRQSLQRLSQQSKSGSCSRARIFSQAALREAQCAKSLNDDTINDVRNRLQRSSTLLEGLSKELPSHASERLKAHDRAIAELGSSLDTLHADDFEHNASLSDASRTELLATALAKHLADTLRDQLDRIFLDSLSGPAGDESPDPVRPEDVQALENDIQALYVEIDDVSSMLVTQEYLQPLRESVSRDRSQRAAANAAKYRTAIQTLNDLTNELSSWDEHAQRVRSGLVLHRHLDTRLSQMENQLNSPTVPTLATSALAPAPSAVSSLQMATERCLSQVGGGTVTPAAHSCGRGDAILDMLESAVSARAAAVECLDAAAQTSTPHSSTVKLDELEARVSEVQRLLHESQLTS